MLTYSLRVLSKAFHIPLRIILIAMIIQMTGGHWMLLQTIAWGRMIVDYSHSSSISTALKETFDGEHPCEMCKGIQKAKQTEKKQEAQQVTVKYDFLFEHRDILIVPPAPPALRGSLKGAQALRTEPPSLRPPRVLPG